MNFSIPEQFQHLEVSFHIYHLLVQNAAKDMNVRKFTKKRQALWPLRSQFGASSPAFSNGNKVMHRDLCHIPHTEERLKVLQAATTHARSAFPTRHCVEISNH
jgi:hypothetical protein